MDWFRDKGYYTIRSYGSKGTFDFLAIPPKKFTGTLPLDWDNTKPYMIQAKTNGYVKPTERVILRDAQMRYDAIVLIAWRENGKILFKTTKELKQ